MQKKVKAVRYRHSFDANGNYLGCVREDQDFGRGWSFFFSIVLMVALMVGALGGATIFQHNIHGRSLMTSVTPP